MEKDKQEIGARTAQKSGTGKASALLPIGVFLVIFLGAGISMLCLQLLLF